MAAPRPAPSRCGAAFARQRAPEECSRDLRKPAREPAPLVPPLLVELAWKPLSWCLGAPTIHGHTPPCTAPSPFVCIVCVMGAGVFLPGVAPPDTWELGEGRTYLPSLDPPRRPPGLQRLQAWQEWDS